MEPARARQALLKKQKQHGYISDGAEKRYWVGVFYVLAGEIEKALTTTHGLPRSLQMTGASPYASCFGRWLIIGQAS